jgi:hypothetical protein
MNPLLNYLTIFLLMLMKILAKVFLIIIKLKLEKLNYHLKMHWYILFNLTQNNKTKIDIVNKFNKDIDNYEKKISRTTFHEKVYNIPLSYYADIHKKLLSIYKNKFNKSKPSIIAVDGTYGNTNVKNIKEYLETSLSMGFFDVTDEIPIELIFKGEESKNKEFISNTKLYYWT